MEELKEAIAKCDHTSKLKSEARLVVLLQRHLG
jgi:hypothetical protein